MGFGMSKNQYLVSREKFLETLISYSDEWHGATNVFDMVTGVGDDGVKYYQCCLQDRENPHVYYAYSARPNTTQGLAIAEYGRVFDIAMREREQRQKVVQQMIQAKRESE